MQNIKLTLGYDGSGYHGFQVQANALTVQEVLEKAIAVVFGKQIRFILAGRTDTGVHATGQVVNFYSDKGIPVDRIPYALNAVLPKDIVVYDAEFVPDSFHARFSATGKLYTYCIDNGAHARVLERNYSYHIKHRLDAVAMAASAAQLVGCHDFASFRATGSSVRSTTRTLRRLDVVETDRFITITAEADGFLYNMVRIITGTLIEVGRGKRNGNLAMVLAAQDRRAAGWTVPPHGLVLRHVFY